MKRIMNMRNAILSALLAVALAACGGGDDAFQPGTGGGGGGTPTPAATTITVVTDSPAIASAGNTSANITAYVKDANNNLLPNVLVQFSSPSGNLAVTQALTDSTGAAKATLSTVDNPANRDITVTATTGSVTGTVTVAVTGTTIDLQGPDALITSTAGNYLAVVTNSAGTPVPNVAVTLTAPSATLNPATLTTDGNGRATFTLTPTGSTAVTLTANGAGAAKSKNIAVSADSFAFTAPTADTQVPLGAPGVNFTLQWRSAGAPVDGPVTLSTTRGTLSAYSGSTVGGVLTVSLASDSAGEAVVTATNSSGGSAQRRVVFVAQTASKIDLQANPFTVAINQSTTLTATVRDANNNLVANKSVKFELTTDATGGRLSVGTATTDSQGRASTVYTAGSTTSANGGVVITAKVINPLAAPPQPADGALPADSVNLTVAGAALFISFGTGNSIQQINDDAQYRVSYTAQVTDANGVGVANVPVSMAVLPVAYLKGYRLWSGTYWTTVPSTAVPSCENEDKDYNGILDESQGDFDENNNDTLEPGNVVVLSMGATATDPSGFLPFTITYPQDHAEYVQIRLRGQTSVQGTEFSRTTPPFWLKGAADDFNKENTAPPGMESPFGTEANCSEWAP
jgi:hypothetical protein